MRVFKVAPAVSVGLSTTTGEGAMKVGMLAAAISVGAAAAGCVFVAGFRTAGIREGATMALPEGAVMTDAMPARPPAAAAEASPDPGAATGGWSLGVSVGLEISSVAKGVVIHVSPSGVEPSTIAV